MTRPEVTNMVIGIISDLMDEQDEKGYKKYNRSIDEAPDGDYDWNVMAMEEMADCMKYLMKENNRLRGIIKELRKS